MCFVLNPVLRARLRFVSSLAPRADHGWPPGRNGDVRLGCREEVPVICHVRHSFHLPSVVIRFDSDNYDPRHARPIDPPAIQFLVFRRFEQGAGTAGPGPPHQSPPGRPSAHGRAQGINRMAANVSADLSSLIRRWTFLAWSAPMIRGDGPLKSPTRPRNFSSSNSIVHPGTFFFHHWVKGTTPRSLAGTHRPPRRSDPHQWQWR